MKAAGQNMIIAWSWLSSLLLAGAVAAVIGFLVIQGLPALDMALIFGRTPPLKALLLHTPVFDGLLPAMAGTFVLVMTAVGLALPLGLGAGIYMAEYCRGRLKTVLTLLFDVLAGVPSIVVGLFGLALTLFLHKHVSKAIYPSLLISALSLAFLVLPYLIRGTQASLESLPANLRLIAPALGATQSQNLLGVLLPRALNGMVSAVMLSISRCAEDTAVIMLTGAMVSAGMPRSLLGGYEALPFYIYYISSQYANQQELLRGHGAALILLLLCTGLLTGSLLLKLFLGRQARG